jgi:hypothetical protein
VFCELVAEAGAPGCVSGPTALVLANVYKATFVGFVFITRITPLNPKGNFVEVAPAA